ncbi:hypothetical protein MRB53_035945 [Persea americana]|uniref:Uncharacterized protein n=1 Tax=Persea americana TaxID=3435 RepID=A0ACC2K6M7_PERAE|nr:hypothetical protein MRB53_035945 [Persea americana]
MMMAKIGGGAAFAVHFQQDRRDVVFLFLLTFTCFLAFGSGATSLPQEESQDLQGVLPPELAKLRYLQQMILRNCNLTGTSPPYIWTKMTNLKTFLGKRIFDIYIQNPQAKENLTRSSQREAFPEVLSSLRPSLNTTEEIKLNLLE